MSGLLSTGLDPRLDPVLYVSVQLLASAAVIGFTAPTSFLRHAVVPLLFTCSYSSLLYAKRNMPPPYAAVFSCIVFCFMMSYVSMAIISGWNFESRGPAPKIAKEKTDDSTPRDEAVKVEKKTGSAFARLTFGLQSILSFRDCGTPHEVKNVPPFIYNDPSFVPAASAFVTRSAVTLIICYFVIDFIESQPTPPNAADIFSADKVSVLLRLKEITLQEVVTRIAASSGFWVVSSTSMMLTSSLINILSVSLGLSKVENCKPILGPMSEAYTLRGFWGKAWHQGLRKAFATPANYVVDEFFVFHRQSPPNTYSKIFVTFFISGVIHAIGDWASGLEWAKSGAIKFFYFQAAGIVVEDAVQLVYRISTGRDLKSPPRLWTRMLGYLWVAFFILFWTTPGWMYPSARMYLGTDLGHLVPHDFSYFRKYAKQ